jgi:hypothetical protein
LARIARPGGDYILEFASKRHFKSILRYWTGRQKWSPFQPAPVEFLDLNFDFHPHWIRVELDRAEFSPDRTLTVSHFRLPVLKKFVPLELLVKMDSLAQRTGDWWQLTPQVFVNSQAPANGHLAGENEFFACPDCRTALSEPRQGVLRCANPSCGHHWRFSDGLYDFKEPL